MMTMTIMDRKLMVAIDGYPHEKDYDWMSEGTDHVSIAITRTHPKYCEKCNYSINQSITNNY